MRRGEERREEKRKGQGKKQKLEDMIVDWGTIIRGIKETSRTWKGE
jgi:hypothetical protein